MQLSASNCSYWGGIGSVTILGWYYRCHHIGICGTLVCTHFQLWWSISHRLYIYCLWELLGCESKERTTPL